MRSKWSLARDCHDGNSKHTKLGAGRRSRLGCDRSRGYLYLKNPQTKAYHGFRFNLDFFAAAGDGTWWHDHRFPGGVAFTANATGHMKRSWTGTANRAGITEDGRSHRQ